MRTGSALFLALILMGLAPLPRARSQPNASVDRVARYLERGDAHRKVGDTVSALAFYRDAINVAPRRSEGYAALGAMYLELGELGRALEVFETGVRAAGSGERLFLGYARALEKVGEAERALDVLRRWVRVEPDSVAGLRALAEAAERRGSFAEALAARRALLDRLNAGGERPEDGGEERAHVRALERLLGAAERVRSREVCASERESNVARALAHCP